VAPFSTAQGLGPLFNNPSCVACHVAPSIGGMGPDGIGTATRVGRLTPSGFDALVGRGGPVARAHSVSEMGAHCDLQPGAPADANVISIRNAPGLYGIGLIDAIPEAQITAGAVARGDGVHGRVNRIHRADGSEQIGRFGWKAEVATVQQFVANALRNEIGITNPLAPKDLAPVGTPGHERCAGEGVAIEDDGSIADALTAFCHTPSLDSPAGPVHLYSDLLLHDVGPDLDDKVVQSGATGRDWRTTPLWGLSARPRFLHDGRATTVTEAIVAHGGEAALARQRFRELPPEERKALLAFLAGL
jgi:CxxC motif-containing protein (DUF1111 family)